MLLKRAVVALLALAIALCAVPAFAKKAPKKMDEQKAISAEYNKGSAAMSGNHWNAAIESFTKVIDNPATNKDLLANAYANRGSAKANKKMDQEGLDDLNKALELNPSLTSALYDRARIYQKLNKHTEAIVDLTKAIELTKSSIEQASYLRNRGISYEALEKRDQAKEDFKKAKQLDPRIKIPSHMKS